MKIADYKKSFPRQEQYSAGDIAQLFGVSHRTACNLIDSGAIKGFTMPGCRDRRVLYKTIETYVAANPDFQYVLDKIEKES